MDHHQVIIPFLPRDTNFQRDELYFKYVPPVLDSCGDRFLPADHVEGLGWDEPLKELLKGKPARSKSRRHKTQKEFRKRNANFKEKAGIRYESARQVEYYLSDKNLRSDNFYRPKICDGEDGWFEMRYIMTAPRIQSKSISMEELVLALLGSDSVETKKDEDGTYWIRRKGGKALPPFQPRTYTKYSSNYGHRRRRNYDDYSDYGFDGGCMGYSGRDCDTLLECGVKPWDDDAGYVLGALNGF